MYMWRHSVSSNMACKIICEYISILYHIIMHCTAGPRCCPWNILISSSCLQKGVGPLLYSVFLKTRNIYRTETVYYRSLGLKQSFWIKLSSVDFCSILRMISVCTYRFNNPQLEQKKILLIEIFWNKRNSCTYFNIHTSVLQIYQIYKNH